MRHEDGADQCQRFQVRVRARLPTPVKPRAPALRSFVLGHTQWGVQPAQFVHVHTVAVTNARSGRRPGLRRFHSGPTRPASRALVTAEGARIGAGLPSGPWRATLHCGFAPRIPPLRLRCASAQPTTRPKPIITAMSGLAPTRHVCVAATPGPPSTLVGTRSV